MRRWAQIVALACIFMLVWLMLPRGFSAVSKQAHQLYTIVSHSLNPASPSLVTAGDGPGHSAQQSQETGARSIPATCEGPEALWNSSCASLNAPLANRNATEEDIYYKSPPECVVKKTGGENSKLVGTVICDYRRDTAAPVVSKERIMIVGDSHIEQWKAPVIALAKERHLRFESLLVGGCPIRDLSTQADYDIQKRSFGVECADAARFLATYVEREKPGIILYSSYAKDEKLLDEYGPFKDQAGAYQNSLHSMWNKWANASQVYVIADTPYNQYVRDLSCINTASDPTIMCRAARKDALATDPIAHAARLSHFPRVTLLDYSDGFCDRDFCYNAVGGMLVYFDDTHISKRYAMAFLDRFRKDIPPL